MPSAQELLAAMTEPDWVAEDPEAHLLPHLQRACRRADSPFVLEEAQVDEDGALALGLRWTGPRRDLGAARAAVFELLAHVAETASYVRQRRDGHEVVYDVVTGMLAPDTSFASHGHVLRLRISGAFD